MKSSSLGSPVRALAIVVAAAAVGGASHCWGQQLDRAETSPDAPANGAAAAAGSAPAVRPNSWTLDEALGHLQIFPRDAYVQYVALQLARREGRLPKVATTIGRLNSRRNPWSPAPGDVDLFSIFSGALAVQESLQLDAMAGDQSVDPRNDAPRDTLRAGPGPIRGRAAAQAAAAAASADTVPVNTLVGPTIKSHPWSEMLAGRSPEVTGLALVAPEDFYFVSFRSVNKLIEAADLGSLWGAHVMNQASGEATTQLVNQRLREQLAVEINPALQPFYDAAVHEVAVVGSDLFLREGSDVTLLFRAAQPELLRRQMAKYLDDAQDAHPEAERTAGVAHGVQYEHLATPDRRLHVFAANPRPDIHVRSNSLAGLQRVLAAVVGRAPRLGVSEEFRYVRTLLPQGAAEEHGLVYLSDPFVRNLMSARLRLTERRRMECYNHLRMIGHAALLYRTEQGKAAASLADLHAADCTPGEFGAGRWTCPEQGAYSLAADGVTGVCTCHGYASHLTPCIEIETSHVTEAEAEAYRQFVQRYNGFWRQFFDPIAIRLQITQERFRAETIVLPLIDNSIYTALAASLGGAPEDLDALPTPERTIFSVGVRLNKSRILHDMGLDELLAADDPTVVRLESEEQAGRSAQSMRRLALAMLNHESARRELPAARHRGLSWRVSILPFLGDPDLGGLYGEFHLDEPWDSEHNRRLIARMPEVFASSNAELNAQGKTRFVVPRGPGTAYENPDRGLSLKRIVDGTSNSALLLETDDAHAVVWTKPDDVELAAGAAERPLAIHPPGASFIGLCDGSTVFLRREMPAAEWAALLTIAGEESPNWSQFGATPPGDVWRRRDPLNRQSDMLTQIGLGDFLTKGIGNQVGFHVYDCDPMVDLSMPQLLGGLAGSFRGRLDEEILFFAPLIGSLNGPVYLSIPVENPQIVDDFLNRLDTVIVGLSREADPGGWFGFRQDFYRLEAEDGAEIRTYVLHVGPLKWRFFWRRIGDGLYIASKREVLDDIAAAAADAAEGRPAPASDRLGHGQVVLRPQRWNQVLETYRLGWEENARVACLKNTGPLASLNRALAASETVAPAEAGDELHAYAARVYDVHHQCPDGGHYHVTADGRGIACSVHGSAEQPRQGVAPVQDGALGRELAALRDIRITLTFLEDGLHAVATIERRP